MKVLIFGASGSGKTFISHALNNLGINAFDADEIEGLSAWYDKKGNKIQFPENAAEALQNHYSFLWSRKFLRDFLKQFTDIYLFGGSGNVTSMFDLFDKVYFLRIEPNLQIERLLHSSRENPGMDTNENGVVIWGDWLEKQAINLGVPIIDASLSPGQIFHIISSQENKPLRK
jgi:hypothetical protein